MITNIFDAKKAIQELENWLRGASNYFTGLQLFLKYGGDKGFHARVFEPKGACRANKQLLKSKIESMIADFKMLIPAETVVSESNNDQADDNGTAGTDDETKNQSKRVELPAVGLRKLYPNLKLEDAPDEIKLMFAEAIATFGKVVTLHDKELTDDMTDDERLAKLTELYEANEENKAAHAELKHFNDTGMLLGKHPKLEMAAYKQNMEAVYKTDPVKVQKERDKCYNNYARHKKQLDEGDFKNKAEKTAFVKTWQIKMEICDELLNSK